MTLILCFSSTYGERNRKLIKISYNSIQNMYLCNMFYKRKIILTLLQLFDNEYDELVCTEGFREDGTWVRIYPIQFCKKSYNEQYKKYDRIELDLLKNDSDFRPESYRLSLLFIYFHPFNKFRHR
jgi:hypothetical protein